ncbi:MAG TPA: alternative ribosome rescue aminoacyl-tRNA hydrolase ArfB [Mucilaginibacter sp.]|jgi:ribosome-associated protein|nr:alternative ribosome rescue aminoacyl-tRNA hydrolase ArfB [Mucilaginibacter sp.]
MNFSKEDLQKEVAYKTSRSGGKGGQNVNKVSSKVELLFSIVDSALFSDDEKLRLIEKLSSRFNKEGYVQIVCDEERSQYLNKVKAIDRLSGILMRALTVQKPRKATKPSKQVKAKRLDEKKLHAVKKENRKRNFDY